MVREAQLSEQKPAVHRDDAHVACNASRDVLAGDWSLDGGEGFDPFSSTLVSVNGVLARLRSGRSGKGNYTLDRFHVCRSSVG